MAHSIDRIHTDEAPAAIGPYSQAVSTPASTWIFVSGQLPVDPKTATLVDGGIKPSARQVFENMAAILKAAHSGMDRVLRVDIFLQDLKDFAAVNEVYAEFFQGPIFPARQTVQVARLPLDALIEASCVAIV